MLFTVNAVTVDTVTQVSDDLMNDPEVCIYVQLVSFRLLVSGGEAEL